MVSDGLLPVSDCHAGEFGALVQSVGSATAPYSAGGRRSLFQLVALHLPWIFWSCLDLRLVLDRLRRRAQSSWTLVDEGEPLQPLRVVWRCAGRCRLPQLPGLRVELLGDEIHRVSILFSLDAKKEERHEVLEHR